MSLLDEALEDFTIVDKTTTNDGYGGFTEAWVDGATVKCAVVLDNSIEARSASKDGLTSVYTLTARKNVPLEYHMVLRRVRDGKIFRVTSDGTDKATPASANLNMRQVSAEEWRLT